MLSVYGQNIPTVNKTTDLPTPRTWLEWGTPRKD